MPRILNILLLGLLASVLFLSSSLAAAQPQAVVFMYHRFGEQKYPSTNVTIDQFEEQLAYLKDNEFKVLPLEKIVEAIRQNRPLPDKTIAITMDDAYRSVYEVAYPRLMELNFPFTVFVATGVIDKKMQAYMSWEQMREMHERGVTFANHTENHEYLVQREANESPEQWAERIRQSIQNGQRRLEEELGAVPKFLAYPYGEYSSEVMEIVQDLGYTAFGQQSGGIGVLTNQLALPRFPIAEAYAGMSSFKTKAQSLPMPVLGQNPVNPVTEKSRPELTLTVAGQDMNLNQLACYFGSERMKIEWLIPDEQFRIQANTDLPSRRSRYNCTAPNMAGDRYFWFSHLWISTH